MKKIFIVLFVLLASSVYAESESIYYNQHQSYLQEDAIGLYKNTEEFYSLVIGHYKKRTHISTVYTIISTDEEELKALLVKLESNYSNYDYIDILKLCMEADKSFEFIKNEIDFDEYDEEKIILDKYLYQYN